MQNYFYTFALLSLVTFISGCVSWPKSFEGSSWQEATITHSQSKINFPFNVLSFAREKDQVREYGQNGDNVSVSYEWPKLFTGAPYRATVYVFQDSKDLNQLMKSTEEEIRLARRDAKRPIGEYRESNSNIALKTVKISGKRATFEGMSSQWVPFVAGAAQSSFDAYEELWLFKTSVGVIKFRFTSSVGEKESSPKKFEEFVTDFFDKQRVRL